MVSPTRLYIYLVEHIHTLKTHFGVRCLAQGHPEAKKPQPDDLLTNHLSHRCPVSDGFVFEPTYNEFLYGYCRKANKTLLLLLFSIFAPLTVGFLLYDDGKRSLIHSNMNLVCTCSM